MKGIYGDRKCEMCGHLIPAKEKYCPSCSVRQGRENINNRSPGSYKRYVKEVENY